MAKLKLSIIIVHYKNKEVLFSCLKSIERNKPRVSFEVLVVDNDEEKTIEPSLKRKFPWVKYIKAEGNIGYGAGNNLGVKHAKGEYLFILNPDTEIISGSIDKLLNFIQDNDKVGIAAPILLNQKGKVYPLQGTGKLTPLSAIFGLSFINKFFPFNPISRQYWLLDWDKRKKREVDVIPGTAFMIRKKLFDEIGGFDEKFFLYFEEFDLCKRIKDLSYKIFMVPEAKIIHLWAKSTSKIKQEKIEKIFRQSRFYYFKKHYGLFRAILVQSVTGFGKNQAILFAILTWAGILRFWKIQTLMMFIGDFGWYYLSAKDFLLNGKIPLVGIASSVPVFKQGALFTWLLAGALQLGDFNPVSGAYLTGILGVLAVWLTYRLASNWFGEKTGFLAALFAATSPLIVVHSRMPYHTAPIFLVTLLIARSASSIVKERAGHYFLLGLWLTILYQFELSGFILLPIILIAFICQKVRPTKQDILRFGLGGIVGLTPFIFWDIRQTIPLQTVGFMIWAFIKVGEGLLGLLGRTSVGNDLSQSVAYFVRLVYPASTIFALIFLTFSVTAFFYFLKQNRRKLKFGHKFIFVWLLTALAGFFLRGVVAEAYMPLIFLPFSLVVALFLKELINKVGTIGWILALTIIFMNFLFLVKTNFFQPEVYGPTLQQRLEIVDFIVKDAGGESYKLVYQGPGDMFEAGDNHYQYLLWWKGNEPKREAALVYTLIEIEPPQGLTKQFDRTKDFGYAMVGFERL